MDLTVDRSWETILGWVEQHSPGQRSLIRGPAAEEDLRAVQQAMDRPLPRDLLAWWRLSDGAEDVFLLPKRWIPCSVARALDTRRMMLEDIVGHAAGMSEREQDPAGTGSDLYWLPSWLPIAHNGGGDHLFVDLREGPTHGCVCKHMKEDRYLGRPEWWSVSDMLSDVANALVDDTGIDGWYPEVVNGHIGWN